MAGGIGSRFWPESRTHHPKQFLDLLGTGRSLIQWTYNRFKHICPKENIYFITNEQYIDTLKQQIPELSDENIISEPSRKNTAPCAAYFAHKIMALNPLANIIMSPADHLIMDEHAFERTAHEALDFVAPAHSKPTTSNACWRSNWKTAAGLNSMWKPAIHRSTRMLAWLRTSPTTSPAMQQAPCIPAY